MSDFKVVRLQVACSSDVKPSAALIYSDLIFVAIAVTSQFRPRRLIATGIIDDLITATKVFAIK